MSEPLLLVEPKGTLKGAFARLEAERVGSELEIRDALDRHGYRALWIAPSAPSVRLLLRALMGYSKGDQRLLSLKSANGERHGLLHAIFRFVVSADEGIRLLPSEELAEALSAPNRDDLFVGGAIAPTDSAVVLYRGSLDPLVVPLRWFSSRPGRSKPDIERLEIADYGQTVRLGDYEAATDAILYEFDSGYRRRAKQRQLERDHSFGGALHRLRLQKGLDRTNFPGLTAKELGRIERGEVKKPHSRTLKILAKRLGVSAKEIPQY